MISLLSGLRLAAGVAGNPEIAAIQKVGPDPEY